MTARTITVGLDGRVEAGRCGEPGCVALHNDGSRLHIDCDGNGWYERGDDDQVDAARYALVACTQETGR